MDSKETQVRNSFLFRSNTKMFFNVLCKPPRPPVASTENDAATTRVVLTQSHVISALRFFYPTYSCPRFGSRGFSLRIILMRFKLRWMSLPLSLQSQRQNQVVATKVILTRIRSMMEKPTHSSTSDTLI